MQALRLWPFGKVVLVSAGWILPCVLLMAAWLLFQFRSLAFRLEIPPELHCNSATVSVDGDEDTGLFLIEEEPGASSRRGVLRIPDDGDAASRNRMDDSRVPSRRAEAVHSTVLHVLTVLTCHWISGMTKNTRG